MAPIAGGHLNVSTLSPGVKDLETSSVVVEVGGVGEGVWFFLRLKSDLREGFLPLLPKNNCLREAAGEEEGCMGVGEKGDSGEGSKSTGVGTEDSLEAKESDFVVGL